MGVPPVPAIPTANLSRHVGHKTHVVATRDGGVCLYCQKCDVLLAAESLPPPLGDVPAQLVAIIAGLRHALLRPRIPFDMRDSLSAERNFWSGYQAGAASREELILRHVAQMVEQVCAELVDDTSRAGYNTMREMVQTQLNLLYLGEANPQYNSGQMAPNT
jgi:hypothetical protein